MQRARRLFAWFVVASAVTCATAARADEPDVAAPTESEPAAPKESPRTSESNVTARASLEVAGYRDTLATAVLTPSVGGTVESPTAGWGITGRYLVDVVSAASPDIVATASPRWTEVRHAGNLGARYKPSTFGVAVSGSTSYTPDYLALGLSGQVIQELDDKNLLLVGGYGYGHDTIGRTGTPFSTFSRALEYHSITAGFSRVVNASLVLGITGDVVIERGDQSKPYRYIPIFAPDQAPLVTRGASVDDVTRLRIQARPLEQLPLGRERYAITGRLGWRGDGVTLRVEERLYHDTWNLHASTTDVRYFVDVTDRVTIWPHGRFHVQNGVDFWKRAYAAPDVNHLPAFRTGDRELGPLATFGLGGGLRLALGKSGAVDDWLLVTTIDGNVTSFSDTLYVTTRFSGLAATSLEVKF